MIKITIVRLLRNVPSFYQIERLILGNDNWKQNHWKMTIHLSCPFWWADRRITFRILSMRKDNKTCVMVILLLCDLQFDGSFEILIFKSITPQNKTLVKVIPLQYHLQSDNYNETLILESNDWWTRQWSVLFICQRIFNQLIKSNFCFENSKVVEYMNGCSYSLVTCSSIWWSTQH